MSANCIEESFLTSDRLKHLLHYDPSTGVFKWKVSNSNRTKAGSVAGCKRKDGYILIRVDGRLFRAHRLAWFYIYGVWPSKEIDHKDRVPDHNWICNLRDVSGGENRRNRKSIKGFTRSGGRWKAQIKYQGKCIHIGCYATQAEASGAFFSAKYALFPNTPK